MFVDETAELGLLSLLTELVVLKSYLDEEVLCKSLVFEVMILVDWGGFFEFFLFKQTSQLSAVSGIWYSPQSGQGRHRLHLKFPVRMSLKHVLQVSNLAVLAYCVGPLCVFAQSLQSLSEFRVSLKWQTLQTYFGLHWMD
jgi:hypothetical protein